MTDEIDNRRKYLHGSPTHLTVNQQFSLILRMLRQQFPPEHPVRVRRLNRDLMGPDAPFGLCSLVNLQKPKSERYFVICLRKTDPWNVQMDTLLHEWAHCLTWYQLEDGKDHGDAFARKHGVLYREFIED